MSNDTADRSNRHTHTEALSQVSRLLRRRIRSLGVTLALGTLLCATLAIAPAGASVATAVFPTAGELTPPANAGYASSFSLRGISCSSAGNCTAVGSYSDNSDNAQAMVATESSGTFATASELTLPSGAASTSSPNAVLYGISCTSAGNCTAVGTYTDISGDNQAMVVTETNGTFAAATKLTLPSGANASPNAVLYGISCSSAGNCTAVGRYYDNSGNGQAMVATETSGTFATATELTLPTHASDPSAELDGISCSSTGNCTAVGHYIDGSSNEQAMVTTETSGTFAAATALTLPTHATDPEASMASISCSSAGNCTAVGTYVDGSSNEQAMVATETSGTFAAATELTLPTSATDPQAELYGISCSSAGICTAVGTYADGSSNTQAMSATESSGSFATATELTLPSGANAQPNAALYGISCSSAGNCTAVGTYDSQAMTATESGGSFGTAIQLAAPANGVNPSASLYGISCSSADNCTAVGTYTNNSDNEQVMAATDTSGTFATATELTLPSGASTTSPNAVLYGISCSSAGNCTAVGTYYDGSGNQQAMVTTETSGAFAAATELTLPPSAADPNAELYGISCSSAGNCTAVGTYNDGSGNEQAMAATESGGTFAAATELTLPAHAANPNAVLLGVSCSSAGNCTAVGYYDDGSNNTQAMVATQSSGTFAAATELTLPAHQTSPGAGLYGISCSSAGNCTAVGTYDDGSGNEQAMAATESGGTFAAATELTLPASATNPAATLYSIGCSSAGNCTAVGDYNDGSGNEQAMVATESGGTFAAATELTLPTHATNPNAFLSDISCSSAGYCTAVGDYDDGTGATQAMAVTSVGSLAVTTASLPSGAFGQTYSATLGASGGAGSYSYSITAGALPSGLSLNASTGAISGTPTSAASGSITFQVTDPGPPTQQASTPLNLTIAAVVAGAPTGASASGGNASASVSWSAPSSNGGASITGYTVTASSGGATCTSSSTSCTVTGLNNGTAYTFTVTATNSAGTSAASSASNAVTPVTVPGAPTGTTATASNASASVSWTSPSSNGGASITDYTVTAAPGGATCTSSSTSCTVTGLTNGTSYTFTVTAANSAGTGAASSTSSSVTPSAPATTRPTPVPAPKPKVPSASPATIKTTPGSVITVVGKDTALKKGTAVTITIAELAHTVTEPPQKPKTASTTVNANHEILYKTTPLPTGTTTVVYAVKGETIKMTNLDAIIPVSPSSLSATTGKTVTIIGASSAKVATSVAVKVAEPKKALTQTSTMVNGYGEIIFKTGSLPTGATTLSFIVSGKIVKTTTINAKSGKKT